MFVQNSFPNQSESKQNPVRIFS